MNRSKPRNTIKKGFSGTLEATYERETINLCDSSFSSYARGTRRESGR